METRPARMGHIRTVATPVEPVNVGLPMIPNKNQLVWIGSKSNLDGRQGAQWVRAHEDRLEKNST